MKRNGALGRRAGGSDSRNGARPLRMLLLLGLPIIGGYRAALSSVPVAAGIGGGRGGPLRGALGGF